MKQRRRRPRPPLQLAALAVVATWIAGFVDTVGYLLLAHVFTANMSGNSVRVGAGGALANGAEVLRRGWPVAFFVAGLLVSAFLHEAGSRHRFLSTSAMAFGAEAALLAAVQLLYLHGGAAALGSGKEFFTPTALLSFAMGMQNATLTKVGALSVRTTHVTGTVSEFADGFSQFAFWAYDRLRATGAARMRRVLRVARRNKGFQQATLMAVLWLMFVAGAIAGTESIHHLAAYLLLPPIVASIALAIVDVLRPMAASAEHERA